MPWTKVKRIRVTTDEPSVTFRKDRISFNVAFVRQSELDKHRFIRLYFDEDERKIGFEFLKEQEDSDVFKIIAAGNKGYSCSSREILDKIWVKKVTKLEKDNSFLAKKDGKNVGCYTMSCF